MSSGMEEIWFSVDLEGKSQYLSSCPEGKKTSKLSFVSTFCRGISMVPAGLHSKVPSGISPPVRCFLKPFRDLLSFKFLFPHQFWFKLTH